MKFLYPFYEYTEIAPGQGRRAYSLLEVLISVAILLIGVLSIVNLFPMGLKAQNRANDISRAAMLAQLKAEEIRRDNDRAGRLINSIRRLRTPTDPVTFPNDTKFAYSFCGISLIDPQDDPDDPRDDFAVPRVIIKYSREYRGHSDEVLFELRFDQ
jgi:prepilin-type N-terminal cleavage/methylation domain-containing protein